MWGPKIVCGGAIIREKSVTVIQSNPNTATSSFLLASDAGFTQ